jgi:hypothetical protein
MHIKWNEREFHYEIRNKKLKALVEKKAQELGISVDQLIWGYINRGIMCDGLNERVFNENHSEKFLKEVNDALGLD